MMSFGRLLAISYIVVFVVLCVISYRWHQERRCVDTRAFDVGTTTLGAKGTWCALWEP